MGHHYLEFQILFHADYTQTGLGPNYRIQPSILLRRHEAFATYLHVSTTYRDCGEYSAHLTVVNCGGGGGSVSGGMWNLETTFLINHLHKQREKMCRTSFSCASCFSRMPDIPNPLRLLWVPGLANKPPPPRSTLYLGAFFSRSRSPASILSAPLQLVMGFRSPASTMHNGLRLPFHYLFFNSFPPALLHGQTSAALVLRYLLSTY